MSEPTLCAWCAPDNRRPAKGSAREIKLTAGRPTYRRAPSCGLPGHGAYYEDGFLSLNRQTLRTEQAANAYAEAMAKQGQPIRGFDLTHLDAMEAALRAADSFESDPRLPTPRNYLTDPATSYRVKRAAKLGVRDAQLFASSRGYPAPENVLRHAAEAALAHLMESLDTSKETPQS